ncbi:biopolymer transporter ExbD, partial [Stenotrophomonas maltophilia]|uniref:ExbD/TolR family protein n=1 Tax=Stenotrophomonas maltophilia TaxID=40324 RepID=UPI00313E927D
NAEGRYFINDPEVLRSDVESVKQTNAAVAGSDREQTVQLRADARTPYQAVVTAQDSLGQIGYRRIAIATAHEVRP